MLLRKLATIVLALGSAAALGWVAFQLQQQAALPRFFFPLIFPLLVGAATGGACVAVNLLMPEPLRTLPAVALVAGIIVVLAQTWFGYRFYSNEIDRQLSGNALAAAARAQAGLGPQPLHKFFATKIADSNGWWLIDAALTIVASTTVGWMLRVPPATISNANSEISNLESKI